MKFYCAELEECGFYIQTFDTEEYKDLICPNCYSPLFAYADDDIPIWEEEAKAQRSYER